MAPVSDQEEMALIERDLDQMIEECLIEPKLRDTAKLLLTALNFGCDNLEKLAELTGLARDFIEPRDRALRASGVWNADGTIAFEYPDGPSDYTSTEFILHVLCAEGLIQRATEPEDEKSRKREELHATLARLFAWRAEALPKPLTPEILRESLTVEALATKDTPPEFAKAVTIFRKFRQDDRLRATRRWLASR